MKKGVAGLLAFVAAAWLAAPACAQGDLSVELRGGVASAFDTFDEARDDVDIETGFGVSGSVTWHYVPALWLYAGYSYTRLDLFPGRDPAFHTDDDAAVDHGVDAGVRLKLLTLPFPLEPYVKFGGVYHKLTFHGAEGEEETSALPPSAFSLGIGIALGGEIRLSPRLSVTTEAGLTSYQPRYGGRVDTTLQMEHVRGDVGVRVRL